MKKVVITLFLLYASLTKMMAQFGTSPNEVNQFDANNMEQTDNRTMMNRDTTKHDDLDIPIGLRVWTIDRKFGDIIPSTPDTLPFTYRNTIFTSGNEGEFNSTGHQGSPRINRIFTDRPLTEQFLFTQPYDYIVPSLDKVKFTNTYSPITNLSFNECGDKLHGEDHIKALFAANFNKKLGFMLKFDYLYARGYYQNQSNSHFNFTFNTSYMTDRYDLHLAFNMNFQKVTENGGITNDDYITHPENFQAFDKNEIPVVLDQNWNRNKHQHILLSHRYKVGFNRHVAMTEDEIKAKKFAIESMQQKEKAEREKLEEEGKTDNKVIAVRPDNAKIAGDLADLDKASDTLNVSARDSLHKDVAKADTTWTKEEFVPVTSFIHTFEWNNHGRIYEAYRSPAEYYQNKYYDTIEGTFSNDSIFDETRYHNVKNTFVIALLEGFNKYAKAGLKVFAAHELRHVNMPDSTDHYMAYDENNISIGAQLAKTQGSLLHYNVTAETWLAGEDKGQFRINGEGNLNFKLLKDTIRFVARASIEHNHAPFYFRHYHSKHFWWDNELEKEIHSKIEAVLALDRTKTKLRVAYDNINKYIYLAQSYNIEPLRDFRRTNMDVAVRQEDSNISVFTAQLRQDVRFGVFNWENAITYQKSSNEDALPVPAINVYSNLYFLLNVAKVLDIRLGGDVKYFSKYYAPDYSPALGQFAVQNHEQKVEIGNYPWINVYADFFLKHARFFLMYTHVVKAGSKEYFLSPHYPSNVSTLRFGISWNFFN